MPIEKVNGDLMNTALYIFILVWPLLYFYFKYLYPKDGIPVQDRILDRKFQGFRLVQFKHGRRRWYAIERRIFGPVWCVIQHRRPGVPFPCVSFVLADYQDEWTAETFNTRREAKIYLNKNCHNITSTSVFISYLNEYKENEPFLATATLFCFAVGLAGVFW